MLSSYEISQMFAAQNSMFLSQQSYAQQIGIPPPPSPAPMLGGHQQSPYSFASTQITGPGARGGNAFAGGAMSAMGAGVTGAGLLGGMMSMTRLGAPLTPFVDPFSSAIGGFRAGGMMGGIAGAALPLALGGAASMAAGAFMHGGQQQQMMTNQLGQFNFLNPQARGGTGFTREDAGAIGSSVRSLAHIPELMTSFEELTKMMPKLKSMGVMQGVKDASEFANRFKETIKTVRDVAKILGTTMEDASEFFAHSRGVGFIGRQSQVQNAMNMQFTMGVTGMDRGQVMGLQQTGAGIALSMGAHRRLGVAAVTNIAQTLGMGQQTGRIAEGELEDITGREGPEAIQAASTRFAGALANIAQSAPAGRLSLAGMVKFDENGKAVGIDDELARRYREGTLSIQELKKRASGLTNNQKISFMGRLPDLAMDYAGKTGPQGIANLLEEAASGRYGNTPEAVNLLLQRQGGLSAGESDIFQSLQGMGGFEGQQKEANLRRMSEASIRERTDPSTILRRLKTRVHTSLFGGLEESGAEMFTSLGKMYDDFVDDLVGRHIAGLTKEGAQALRKAVTGANKDDLKALFGMSTQAMPSEVGTGNRFRETEFAATLLRTSGETGRTGAGQYAYNKQMLGGLSTSDAGRLNAGAGRFAGMGGAREAIRSIVDRHQDEFDSASDSRKADIVEGGLKERLQSSLMRLKSSPGKLEEFGVSYVDIERASREAGSGSFSPQSVEMFKKIASSKKGYGDDSFYDIVQAGVAGQKAFPGVGFVRGAAAAATGGYQGLRYQYDFSKLGNLKDASRYMDDKARDEASRAARDALDETGLAADTRNLLYSNPEARNVVQKILAGDTKVRDALDQADVSTTVAMLKQSNIDVNPADVPALRKAVAEARNKTREGVDVSKHLQTLSDMKKFQDLSAIRDKFSAASSRLGDALSKAPLGVNMDSVRALRTAMGDVASHLSGGRPDQAGDAVDRASSAFSDSVKALRGAKGADRAAIAAALGEFGSDALDVVSTRERLSKSAGQGRLSTTKGLADAFHLSEEDVSKTLGVMSGSKFKVSEADLDKIQTLASREGFGRSISGAQGTPKDEQMINTLKAIEMSQKKSLDVMVAIGGYFEGVATDKGAKEALHAAVEGGKPVGANSVLQ